MRTCHAKLPRATSVFAWPALEARVDVREEAHEEDHEEVHEEGHEEVHEEGHEEVHDEVPGRRWLANTNQVRFLPAEQYLETALQ